MLSTINFTATESAGRFLLLMLLLAPLVAVPVIAAGRSKRPEESCHSALVISLLALLLAVGVLALHLTQPGVVAAPPGWVPGLLIVVHNSLALGVDGISIWLVALTAVLTPLAILASARAIREQAKTYYSLLMLLETAMLGVFLARDLLWFYIFFEFTLVPLFFIIGVWGGEGRRRAAYKFFVYTLAGSMMTLAVILYLGYAAGMSFSFDDIAVAAGGMPADVQVLLFLGLFAGFAVKTPLFPLHTWLPLAHTEAPTAGSVILAGVLLKLGTYGFLRIGVGFLPAAALRLAPIMAALAVAGIVWGALAAWVQSDFKKLIAYSSIAHLGFCMLGMFAMRPEALTGSVLVMVNHGLSTGALFIVAGMIYERYHTRRFDDLGGLGRRMPVISFFLVLFALSSLGLPGLNGFVGEFLVLVGAFASGRPGGGMPAVLNWPFAAIAAFGVVLSAVYLLHLVGRLVFGPLRERTRGRGDARTRREEDEGEKGGRGEGEKGSEDESGVADASPREWAILLPLAALIVLLGVWPAPLTRSMAGPVRQLLRNVAAAAETMPPANTVSPAATMPAATMPAATMPAAENGKPY